MKKIFYFFLIAGSVCLAQSSYSTNSEDKTQEKSVANEEKSDEEYSFPTVYKHKNVQEQIKGYRKIYNPLFQQGKDFYTTHVDGLFDVLKNGIALVCDTNDKSKAIDDNKKSGKEIIDYLSDVIVLAQKDKKITIPFFINACVALAEISDFTKHEENTDFFYMYVKGIKEHVREIEQLSNKRRILRYKHASDYAESIWFDKKYRSELLEKPVLIAPMVIFTNNPKTSIAPKTFVEQYLNPGYAGAILLLDVNIAPNDKRKLSHNSAFNTTLLLLQHDIQHLIEQQVSEADLWFINKIKEKGLNWRSELLKIEVQRQTLLKEEKSSESKILGNGLYILSHELYNIIQEPKSDNTGMNNRRNDIECGSRALSDFRIAMMKDYDREPTVVDVVHKVCDDMVSELGQPDSKDEKIMNIRTIKSYLKVHFDQEKILHNVKDLEGKDILPTNFAELSTNEQRLTIIDGYKKFWYIFLVLIEEKE